jgi:hypothetical protein
MSKAFDILRRSHRFTLLMGMVALLVLSLWVTWPPAALAATLRPQNCDFYSDASYSTVVGQAHYNCRGQIVVQSGTVTAYRVCDYDYCCGTAWC